MSYIPSNFKNPKYKITSHTSAQITSSTAGTLVTLNGSEISYTPNDSCDNVVYEISFYSEKINSYITQYLYLEEYNGSSWVEIDASYRKNIHIAGPVTGQSNRFYTHYRFVLPSWTGNKDLRITLGSQFANNTLSLHQMTQWDGTTSTTKFCNTNLLVYSI